ncbi:MAG: SDR family oxidoreductase [Chthoniobacterales bacterium]
MGQGHRELHSPGPTHSAGLEDFVTQFGGGQSFEAIEKEFFKSVRPRSLIKRFETPDEIARLVTFVCSPVASAINGAPLRVDGGVVSSCFQRAMPRRRMMSISTHDRISGIPGRVKLIEEFIRYAQKQKGVVFMRKDEIAKWALSALKIPHES